MSIRILFKLILRLLLSDHGWVINNAGLLLLLILISIRPGQEKCYQANRKCFIFISSKIIYINLIVCIAKPGLVRCILLQLSSTNLIIIVILVNLAAVVEAEPLGEAGSHQT